MLAEGPASDRDSDLANKASVSPLMMVLLAACVLLPSTWGAYRVTAMLEQREYEQLLDERAAGQFSVVRSALNELVGVLAALRSFVEINGSVRRWELITLLCRRMWRTTA